MDSKKAYTKDELMQMEDDEVIIKGYKMLKNCVDDLISVCRKTDSVREYCSARDFSINGMSYEKEVENCCTSIQKTAQKLEEFAELLVSVVDKDTLQQFFYKDNKSTTTGTKLLEVTDELKNVSEKSSALKASIQKLNNELEENKFEVVDAKPTNEEYDELVNASVPSKEHKFEVAEIKPTQGGYDELVNASVPSKEHKYEVAEIKPSQGEYYEMVNASVPSKDHKYEVAEIKPTQGEYYEIAELDNAIDFYKANNSIENKITKSGSTKKQV